MNYEKEYEKVKHIPNEYGESGYSEKGNFYRNVEEISPKFILVKNFLVEKLKEKGYADVATSTAKSGTIYVYPFGVGLSRSDIRISDHMGRGGVFKTSFDIETLDHAKQVLNKIPDYSVVKKKDEEEKQSFDKKWQEAKNLQKKLAEQGLSFSVNNRTYDNLESFSQKNPLAKNIRQIKLDNNAFKYQFITRAWDMVGSMPDFDYVEWLKENKQFKNGGIVSESHSALGLANELKLYPKIKEHDSIAECADCNEKFTYLGKKDYLIWGCPYCHTYKPIHNSYDS